MDQSSSFTNQQQQQQFAADDAAFDAFLEDKHKNDPFLSAASHEDPNNAFANFNPTPVSYDLNTSQSYTNNSDNGNFTSGGNMMISQGSSSSGGQKETPLSDNRSAFSRFTSLFQFSTYQKYFDVDTADVAFRMRGAITYFNVPGGFKERILSESSNVLPDAYGPFWIMATLVFFVAIASNVLMWASGEHEDFVYKIDHLVKAMWVLYSFAVGLPTALSIAFRCFNIELGFVDVYALYGYSMVSFLPAVLICSIPNHLIIWVVLAAATAVSLIFILRNLIGPIMEVEIHRRGQGKAIAGPLLGAVIGGHVVFLLVLKIAFFNF